jgi:hypothetical protein
MNNRKPAYMTTSNEPVLFDIPVNRRKVVFYLGTYKGNRIVTKLLSLLKGFEINDVDCIGETRIFEISVFSDKETEVIVKELKKEIVKFMETDFPDNYLFDLKERRLGFINSFNVFSDAGFHFEVCHKIKEVRTNGGTSIPDKKIIL